jgi:hypothetical protein
MSRILFVLLFAATATPLAAFFNTPKGFSLDEYIQTGGTSGIVWDPAGADFYAGRSGGVFRFDTTGNAFAGTPLFTAPATIAPAGYASFDRLAIDPASPNDFYVSYSGFHSRMHKLTRTGPDASTVVVSLDYNINSELIYDMAIIPSVATVPVALRGLLVATIAQGFGGPVSVYVIDKNTLALTELADVGTANGSGPIAVDSNGNIFTVIPPVFTSFTGAELIRFNAADLVTALGGTPVAAAQADVLIGSADAAWNISGLAARDEAGGTFLYYTTQEHSSVFRMCVETGESRQFIQGFGGISDGYMHYAQAGSLAFSSALDGFQPASGGAVRLAIPFGVFTPGGGFSSVYNSVFFFEPEPVNIAVASLTLVQGPAAINDGVPFSLSVTAHNAGGGTITSNVAVVVTAAGVGDLNGFTVVSLPGSAINVAGLVYTTPTVPGTVTLTVAVSGAPGVSVSTAAIPVVAPATTLAVVSPPTSVNESTFFSVTTEVRDAGGVVVQAGQDASREVSVVALSGPGNLWGQTTVVASAGVALFDALIIDAPGTYVLEFSSPGLPSQTINLTVTAASAGGSDSDNGNDSSGICSTGASGGGWLSLLGVLAVIGVAVRLRRTRTS